MKYSVITFGCRVNQADSLGFEEELRAAGAIGASPEHADLVVVNTCSVTATADQGARQTIRRVARDNPSARIVVTGCYATRRPDEVAALPNVLRVIPNDDKPRLLPLILRRAQDERTLDPLIFRRAQDAPMSDPLTLSLSKGELTTTSRFGDGDGACGAAIEPGVAGRTAYTLRVQTGCAEPCSYCIIPATRGRPRSVPLDEILREVERVSAAGFKEIALTGVHLGSYGRDLTPSSSLIDLLQALATVRLKPDTTDAGDTGGVRLQPNRDRTDAGDTGGVRLQPDRDRTDAGDTGGVRLQPDRDRTDAGDTGGVRLQPNRDRDVLFRISSLEPMDCCRDIVHLVATSDRFAPHFHLPLQHASNHVLALMRRPYTIEYYADLVDDIRARIPNASIGTDIIVGFPGETETDFELLASYLERSPLTHVHVFPYSDRPGTVATSMTGKVPGVTVRERARRVREIGQRLTDGFRASQIGTTHRALTLEDGSLVVTGNYLKLRVPPLHPRNEWVRVRMTSHHDGELLGG